MSYQPAIWQPCYNQSFTSRNLSTSPLTVGGLKGDTYDYKVIIYKKSTGVSSAIYYRCNGDTGANYRRYLLAGSGATVSAVYSNDPTFVSTQAQTGTNASYSSIAILEITGKSGGERVMQVAGAPSLWDAASYISSGANYWKNTADELTSLVFFSSDNVTQDFDLVILQKPKLAQDAEWELVGKKDFANVDLNSVFTGFSGLDGDRDEEYLLKGCFTASAVDSVYAHLNSDAGANYTTEILRNNVGTAAASNNTSGTGVYLGSTTPNAAQPIVFEARIKAKSGVYRQAQVSTGGGSANYTSNGLFTEWWRNTADRLENIKLICAANATGYIELYRRGKSVSASKPTFETLKEVSIDGEFSHGYTFDLAGLGVPDADNESMLVLEWTGVSKTAGQTNLSTLATLNGDTGNNYYKQRLYASNSTAAAGAATEATLHASYANVSYPSSVRVSLFPKSGKYRPALVEYGCYDGTSYITGVNSVWWLNTADKLRSIKVYATSVNQTLFKGSITLKRLVP